MLDDKGRCCGRKPIVYKGGGWRHLGPAMKFCDRCCRAYHPETGEQMPNFAWEPNGDRICYSFTHALAKANTAPVWGEP